MRALVTGGNGFLGSHLCRALLEAGWEVRVLVQPGTDTERLEGLPLHCLPGDLLAPHSLERACAGVRVVFHLAGVVADWGPAELFWRVNVGGTRTLLAAAARAGAQRLVFVSSLAVHRYVGISDGDESWPRDNTDHPYGASKIACEDLLLKAHARGELETVVVRPGVVPFGPGDRLSLPGLLRHHRRYLHVAGGRARFCTAYAPNLAEGLLRCAEVGRAGGQVYVLADPKAPSWRTFVGRLFEGVGLPRPEGSVPLHLALAGARLAEAMARARGREPLINRYRVNLVGRPCVFHAHKAAAELGYRPPVGLDAALEQTIAWLRGPGRALW